MVTCIKKHVKVLKFDSHTILLVFKLLIQVGSKGLK